MRIKGWKKIDESTAGNGLWRHKRTGNEVETMYNPLGNEWYMNYKGGRWRSGFADANEANEYAVEFMRIHPNG